MVEKTLGILELENEPVKYPGFLAGPATFQFPVKRIKVVGATARKVIDSDRSVKENYVHCARQLEREGVAAIIANCGFTGLFQVAVSAAVSVPVGLSSLLLVPLVAKILPPERKVGILTYDAGKLTEDHFTAAGWSSADIDIAVGGIEGTKSYPRLLKPIPDVDPAALINDVLNAAMSLMKTEPRIAAFVFECTGFPIASDAVRKETGLPVADCVRLATMLLEMSSGRLPATPAQG